MTKPVRIRGTEYESQAAAAQALGVSHATIYKAVKNGHIDKVGMSGKSTEPIPVAIGGVEFPSLSAAARAIGVTAATVGKAKTRETRKNQEAMVRDAERYRWLRARNPATITKGGIYAGMTAANVVLTENELDEAIDRHMAATI